MAVDEQVKLAFAAVSDLTKQLITLGTGVLTLEVAFTKAFVEKAVTVHWQGLAAWVLLLSSVVAGIWVMMALAGTQAKEPELKSELLYARNIRIPSTFQVLLFVLGMVMSIWFGLVA